MREPTDIATKLHIGRLDHAVMVELQRAAVLARRPGIAVLAADARRADAVTGSRARTHGAIGRLVASGRAVPVRRGLLVLRNEIGIAQATLLELVDAAAPGEYLVTGRHALHAHGLGDARGADAVVLVTQPVADFAWGSIRARHLRVGAAALWGGRRTEGNPARPGPVVADPERALLDAVAHPRFGVPLAAAAGAAAIALERDPGFPARLAAAARRRSSVAIARRAGYLLERVAGAGAAAPLRDLARGAPAPTPLLAGGPRSGPVDRRWRVRVNAPLDAPQGTALT